MFETIFSLRVHGSDGWIQTTVSNTARGCVWMSPEETVVVFCNRMLVVYILM